MSDTNSKAKRGNDHVHPVFQEIFSNLYGAPKMNPKATCKHGSADCGQTTYQCGPCEREAYEAAGRRMTAKDHAYDAWALSGSRSQDDSDE